MFENTRGEGFLLDTNITADVQKSDGLESKAGSILLDRSAPERRKALMRHGLEHLAELGGRQRDGVYETNVLRRLQVPLEFSQVEMLEAELKNQGILPRNTSNRYSLTQIGSQESSLWRWRAERYGGTGKALNFTMHLPEFVVARAEELVQTLETGEQVRQTSATGSVYSRKVESQLSIREELNYLERFAAYLGGAYDHAENRYQRGLNLVLQVLSCSALRSVAEAESGNEVNICLPVSKQEFVSAIKSAKLQKQVETILR